ncbi:MAG TPA: type IX secretion system membrane protein PorP/SprF [Flavobacterium sp.]|jgi:type IX secretion system PorP/SprF family membrane protein
MKKIILFVSFTFFINTIQAQQDPEYTQYMYNMSVVNPAYATAQPAMLDIGLLYRTQWVGAVGAPKTATFFGHSSLSKKVEVGLSVISDDIGEGAKKENNFFADFAYVLEFNKNHKLSLGLKAGFSSFETNFNGFKLESGNVQTDLAFSENINIFRPNFGIGAFYFTDQYYVGLSAPNLIPSKHIEERSGINALGSEDIHVFLTGGYVFDLSDSFRFKPAFMSRIVAGAPLSFDVTANVLYNNTFELGAAYRVGDAISILMNANVTRDIKVGYAYDYTLSNLGQFNSGTHEFFILFNLDLLGKGYDKSPRFF